jgi:hypothetical protein
MTLLLELGNNISLIYYGNLEKSLVPFLFCFPALKYIYNDTLLNQ